MSNEITYDSQGRLSPNNQGAIPPNFPLSPPFPIPPFPFPSPLSPPLVLPSPLLPSIPLLPRSGPLKPAGESGERCKLPQWGLGRSPCRRRFWCILKGKTHLTAIIRPIRMFILKFVKFLMKSPKNVHVAFVANGR